MMYSETEVTVKMYTKNKPFIDVSEVFFEVAQLENGKIGLGRSYPSGDLDATPGMRCRKEHPVTAVLCLG